MSTVTPTLGLDLPPAVDQFYDCGCTEVIEHYILLFPYYWLAGSLVFLVTMNVLATMAGRGCSCESFGTVLLMSFMSPSLLFLAPQAAFHLFHYVWLLSGVFQWFEIPSIDPLVPSDAPLTYWDKYQIVYAQWANSGAVAFMVTGCICPLMAAFLRQILQVQAARKRLLQDNSIESGGCPCITVDTVQVYRSPGCDDAPSLCLNPGAAVTMLPKPAREGWVEVQFVHETYSSDKFTGYLRDNEIKTDIAAAQQMKFKSDELQKITDEMKMLGKTRNPIFRELTSYLMVILFLPCVFTHIIPGFVLYFWIVGPLILCCRFLIIFAVAKPTPSTERYSMWYRSIILMVVAFTVSACFQISFNYSMFTYIGKIKYFDVVSNEYESRRTDCAMCMLVTVQHGITAMSFL
eukprot:TRINITY_DN18660_c0_g1_i1.p1 TRINITY_DN18660_c0_g1~~TRINITY_DN18660_c0_g1_i1.p1  ORF type:complete len:405 (+),score=30.61 TRINITY_DN18660_c0_g1_i1:95-1309(+)